MALLRLNLKIVLYILVCVLKFCHRLLSVYQFRCVFQMECNPDSCSQMTATEQWIFLCAAHKTPKEVSFGNQQALR